MSTEKTSYTDEELQEFKELILHKLDQAIKDYELLRGSATNSSKNDVADTLPTFKAVHEGAASLSKGMVMVSRSRSVSCFTLIGRV